MPPGINDTSACSRHLCLGRLDKEILSREPTPWKKMWREKRIILILIIAQLKALINPTGFGFPPGGEK